MKMPEIGSLCEVISIDDQEHEESDNVFIGQYVAVVEYEKTSGIGLTDDDQLIVCNTVKNGNRCFYKENLKVIFNGFEKSSEREAFVERIFGTDEQMIAEICAMSDEEVTAELVASGLNPNSGMERLKKILADTEPMLREKINGKQTD